MDITIAHVRILGASPYSQSRKLQEEKPAKQSYDEFEEKVWLQKLNLGEDGTVIIPAHGIQQALIAAAKYSAVKIKGMGMKTWTEKFRGGVMIQTDGRTGLTPDAAKPARVQCSPTGVRGGGKRVTRIFPVLNEWSAEFDVLILDPIVNESVLRQTLTTAGLVVGLGRFRPENGGSNGRFTVDRIDWSEAAPLAA